MNDICDKLNFITNYTHFTTTNTYFIKKHIYYNIDTYDGDNRVAGLSISAIKNALGYLKWAVYDQI